MFRHGFLGKLCGGAHFILHKGKTRISVAKRIDPGKGAPLAKGVAESLVQRRLVFSTHASNVQSARFLGKRAYATHVVSRCTVSLTVEDVHARVQLCLVLWRRDPVEVVALVAFRAAAPSKVETKNMSPGLGAQRRAGVRRHNTA